MQNYRARVYGHYNTARESELAPPTLAGLESRSHFIRKMIVNHFPSDKNAVILDIGCGHGAILYFAIIAGYVNAYGVDGSAEQVSAAHKLGISSVRQEDLKGHLLSVSAGSLDCIIAFDVIEHFRRDELIELVDLVHRALKPGGRWIIHTPNGESPFAGRMLFGDFTHETLFTKTSVSQLLLSSGFANVRCFEDRPIPHGLVSSIRFALWHCIRCVLRLYLAVESGDAGRNAVFSQNFLVTAISV